MGVSSDLGNTIVIVSVKHCLKELNVQSDPCGDMMQRRGSGNGVGNGVACELGQRN